MRHLNNQGRQDVDKKVSQPLRQYLPACREVNCSLCRKPMFAEELHKHETTECPLAPCECSNGCDAEGLTIGSLRMHLNHRCPYRIVDCSLGCGESLCMGCCPSCCLYCCCTTAPVAAFAAAALLPLLLLPLLVLVAHSVYSSLATLVTTLVNQLSLQASRQFQIVCKSTW